MWRFGTILIAIVAGAGAGAFVFKVVGEEQIGGSVKTLAARLGFANAGSNATGGALDLLDKVAPGAKNDLQGAVILTVVATVVAAAATAVILNEIGEEITG